MTDDITFRTGNSSDLSVILDFLDERTLFSGYIGYAEPEKVRRVIAASYRKNVGILDQGDKYPFFIAEHSETGKPLGYMLTIMGVEESITGELQAHIYDHYVSEGSYRERILDCFTSQVMQRAAQEGLNYVTTEILVADSVAEEYFKSRNYYIEMNRIVKRVETFEFNTPRQKRYRVRPAAESDWPFILLLNAQNSSFLIPTGREADKEKIRQSFFDTYAEMNIVNDRYMKVFIGEEPEVRRQAGYIIIKVEALDMVSEKPLAYIYDINVHRDYWGKYITQRLVKEAQNHLAGRGVEYLIGDTAESNPRPLKVAIKTLGFNLYSRRWVKKIRAQ